jgi:hypothetical protein
VSPLVLFGDCAELLSLVNLGEGYGVSNAVLARVLDLCEAIGVTPYIDPIPETFPRTSGQGQESEWPTSDRQGVSWEA